MSKEPAFLLNYQMNHIKVIKNDPHYSILFLFQPKEFNTTSLFDGITRFLVYFLDLEKRLTD